MTSRGGGQRGATSSARGRQHDRARPRRRNHAAPASVPSPTAWTTPSTQASAVKRCRLRQRAGPIRAADVVGEPEQDQHPAGDDADRRPQPLVAARRTGS